MERDVQVESLDLKNSRAIDDTMLEEDTDVTINYDVVDFRFNQPEYSQLAEYITELRPENPKMLGKLALDQQKIRAKYGLPSIEWGLENPAEYERFLKNLAKKNKVYIRNKLDCGKLFVENDVGAVFMKDPDTIGIDIDRSRLVHYLRHLRTLEHEVIHSIQEVKFPSLLIEIMEYEAYVANCDLNYLEEKPEDIGRIFFGLLVGASVSWWYNHINEKHSKNSRDTIQPKWKDPEFFLLNIDKVNKKDIKNYKENKVFFSL